MCVRAERDVELRATDLDFGVLNMPTYNELVQASYNNIPVPQDGEAIEYSNGKFTVPDHPIIPFIEGDGTGRDIWKASRAGV